MNRKRQAQNLPFLLPSNPGTSVGSFFNNTIKLKLIKQHPVKEHTPIFSNN
jgi:hypothetical protein